MEATSKKIDWVAIKQHYFSNPDISIQDVSATFRVRYYTVRNKAAEHKWFQERRKQFIRLEEGVLETQEETMLQARNRHLELLRTILTKLTEELKMANFSVLNTRELLSEIRHTLQAERELYPKQFVNNPEQSEEKQLSLSPEVSDAFNELLKMKLLGNAYRPAVR